MVEVSREGERDDVALRRKKEEGDVCYYHVALSFVVIGWF